uniref:Erbin n=1 Tax=Gouania willdenowi TaxID=441366 RepID=A0A8C5N922_GOUWI
MSKRSFFVRLVPCRCLRGEEEAVTSLDYSHCSLETVPKEIFSFEKTLQELFLDANQIEELPKQLFNCQLLNRLSMPDNDLSVLPAAIANLINLRELDVSKNSIQEFPENIKNCKVLAVVEASVNPISKLPEGFTQLLSLTQLYLNDAFLEFLPANFGRLTKLQILELRENQLKTLPKSMHKLTQLERLDLGSNEFTEVPEVLEQLIAIKELWMDGNRLTFLPGMLGMLKQLVYLDVSKNSLEMVDEKICGCENLQDLLLSNNALTQLPGSIGSLKKLTALKVDENQLMYLPDSIGGLMALDELDCSFNEIEALPSSIGQCVNIRTFAADHNFLSLLPPEIGSWKNVTVLFLHSNKLESLPEEMGDMHKLKVINLSNNKLKSLPYSFTKLNEMTAMWLSENQSKPLIPLQKEEDPETQKTMLTNYMFPQQTRTEEYIPNSDSESFNPVLWEEQRKHRAQVAFECDEDKDEREAPPREGNLKRYPTPYPDELKNMVKTAQSVAHRLKEDESTDESGKDPKPVERNHIGVQDVGVKVSEQTFIFYCVLRNHRLPFIKCPDSEELSDEEEEMKIAEMRPPLIEISINQPKVVTLSKDKKGEFHFHTLILKQDNQPENITIYIWVRTELTDVGVTRFSLRHEDENMNQPKETTPLLHNGNGSETSLQSFLKNQQSPPDKLGDYDLSMEARLAFIEKGINNGNGDAFTKWDQINMNVTDNMVQLDTSRNGSTHQDDVVDHVQNGNLQGDGQAETGVYVASTGVTACSDMSLSRSTEELSPEKRCPPPQVVKSYSISNMEAGGLKLYSFDGDDDAYETGGRSGGAGTTNQGQSIIRSKSAGQLLNEQSQLVCPGASASSDLLSSNKPANSSRYPVSSSMAMGLPPPQYNIQYTSSGVPKDTHWAQRTAVPLEHQGYPPPPPHSLANTNYSNRNQAPPYPLQPQQRPPLMAPKPCGDMWSKERLHATAVPVRSSTLQRQSSISSTASISDHRRLQLPEGEYMTYRDIHTLARGPLAMSHAAQRPLSARTFSIDVPGSSRPISTRPQPHELSERTMSVSDFNYQHGSPGKRPNARVRSEHSLLDGPGTGRVPTDWRDQVMRHIEAKKMEKVKIDNKCFLIYENIGIDIFGVGHFSVPLMNSQMGPSPRTQASMARHPSREQLIDYLMLKVSQQPQGPSRGQHDALQQELRVKVEKNPELGFSISGGIGGRGNPFRPDDNGIFVTRVQPEGPASKILQPGDKILQANGYSFVNIDHGNAVALLKTFSTTVDLTIIRDVQA